MTRRRKNNSSIPKNPFADEEFEEAMKQEEPKKEEPKQEEPKQEEPKQEEPRQEEPRQEEPKQEEPKKEEPKAVLIQKPQVKRSQGKCVTCHSAVYDNVCSNCKRKF